MNIVRLLQFTVLSALLFLTSACTTEVVRPEPRKVNAKTLVLLPVASVRQNIGSLSGDIEASLYERLTKDGFEVILPDPQTFEMISTAAMDESGSIYNPNVKQFIPYDRAVYMKALIDLLKKYYAHDAILDPEVLLRSAKVSGDDAVWDGIKREVEVIDAPTGYRLPPMAKGISLRLASYTRNGSGIVLTFAGIDLPYVVEFRDKEPQFVLKDQYFTEKEAKDAVKRVLEPFFQRVELTKDD